MVDFEGLGLTSGSFLVTFEGPVAPGHAPGGSLCSKGGLDRFWERFWEPNGRPREPKCLPKSIQKSMKFGKGIVCKLENLELL